MIFLTIDKTSKVTFIKQVTGQIRLLILRGDLKSGEKLPSTRDLANQLKVSRNVILEAYELLTAEGYLTSTLGSGTYVAEGTLLQSPSGNNNLSIIDDLWVSQNENKIIDFRSGVPALNHLPLKKWGQLEQQILDETPEATFGYGLPEGVFELREAICQYVRKARGVQCQPNQIIITTGAVQGLFILSQILLGNGENYLVEDPINRHIFNIFAANSRSVIPIGVDSSGFRTDLLPKNIKPALIMLTPSHQYPLGAILPIQRRIQIIEYARSNDSYIIEDDYDSEFRYEGLPISSLQGLDPNRVIYVGTFSKVLFPALRLGYTIVPPILVKHCRELKYLLDNHSHILSQLTLARFIKEGHLEKHIERVKKIYHQKRNTLISALENVFSGKVRITGQSTGLHLIAEFEGILFTDEVTTLLNQAGVNLYPVEDHAFKKGLHQNKIIMGYSHLSVDEIQEGIARLHKGLSGLI